MSTQSCFVLLDSPVRSVLFVYCLGLVQGEVNVVEILPANETHCLAVHEARSVAFANEVAVGRLSHCL